MSLGRVLLAVEFCPPLTARELRSCLRDPAIRLARRLASVGAELTLAYPLAPPGAGGRLEERRKQIVQLGRELAGEGVGVGLWPILEPQEWTPLLGVDYYFACSATARIFEQAIEAQLEPWSDWMSHLLIDFEPPQFAILPPARMLSLWWRSNFISARRCFERIQLQLRQAGAVSVAGFFPPLVLDLYLSFGSPMQRLAAVPVFDVAWDYYAPLYYSTFVERYLKLPRSWARDYALRAVRNGIARWGERVVPLLGTLGPGLRGEPDHFERPVELAGEIQAAFAAGARHVGIYNLEGILFHYRRGQLVGRRSCEEIDAFFRLLRKEVGGSAAAGLG